MSTLDNSQPPEPESQLYEPIEAPAQHGAEFQPTTRQHPSPGIKIRYKFWARVTTTRGQMIIRIQGPKEEPFRVQASHPGHQHPKDQDSDQG